MGAICLMLFLLVPGTATAVVIPKDLPTIEALIALHKCIKKDEDQALGRVATSFGEQSLVTKGANKFNEVRTTLNTKMSNAHSYLVLAGAISSTANSLYMLVKEYKDFTSNTFKHVKKKPFVGWYYADANVAIAREVKHCYKLYASVAASGINLMKASMDEKLYLFRTLLLVSLHFVDEHLPVVKELLTAAVFLINLFGGFQYLSGTAVIPLEYNCRNLVVEAISQ